MAPDTDSSIPTTGQRTQLDAELRSFLESHPDLHLGGEGSFEAERQHHTTIFGLHSLPAAQQASIGSVDFTGLRGPHGTIPIRVLYPRNGQEKKDGGQAGALIYFHGGGYTVGTVDEFENGLRILAEVSGSQVYAVEYRLAPGWRYPTQLDEYDAVIDALQSSFGSSRGVHPDKVFGGGDSAGGNMTAAITLRRKDQGKKALAGQMLLYPEARLPFDTPAATENNSGYYLECNGIFSFADHYLPRDVPPATRYVSPGMQPVENLAGQPPACIFTCGFDPLRDVGIEYAHKLQAADIKVTWKHYPSLTHGFLQFAPWSDEAMLATKDVGKALGNLAYAV